jgi:hypothetical protein
VFEEPEFAWAAGDCPPEVLWACGPDGERTFARLAARPPASSRSALLAVGGYAVMGSGWQADAHQMIVDVGPLGCPTSGAHGHADLLSVQCTAFGEPFIVDPGTYCYTANPIWRDHFRGTSAHSTVIVDHEEQAVAAGPFSWRGRPAARLGTWACTPTHDVVDASHDAYGRLPSPVRHRRRVLFLRSCGWAVVDDLTGVARQAHDIELRFQLSPRRVALDDEGWVRIEGAKGRGLWMLSMAPTPLVTDIREGERDPIEGWVSSAYGVLAPAPMIITRTRYSGAIRLVTVVIPASPLRSRPPVLDVLRDEASVVTGVRFPGDSRLVEIDDASLTVGAAVDAQRTA